MKDCRATREGPGVRHLSLDDDRSLAGRSGGDGVDVLSIAILAAEKSFEEMFFANLLWAAALGLIGGAWLLAALARRRRDLQPNAAVLGWQAVFWVFFLACMIGGLLPVVNP
nr:hypothetical protein fc141 [uncultured bacterium]